ncbi:MAG: hypothetical protein H6934_12090 [Burkholderiaceae bacterium]|nr:hypothetical protein [Burkholderiaceae bacterium]
MLLAAGAAGLMLLRHRDLRDDARTWAQLASIVQDSAAVFDANMVAGLPEPARRYFEFTIRPGTRLRTAVELRMNGVFALGDKANPNEQALRAHQLLVPPAGFVWKARMGDGAVRIVGSDGQLGARSWTRFRLFDLVPVARAGGDPDHARSAFGRTLAEAAIWTPAALLPAHGTRWEAVDENTARATVRDGERVQAVDIRVDEDGRPTRVSIARWSNANPEKRYRIQPFGGELSDYREFDGFRVPTRVEGGNFIGTNDYFAFYRVEIEQARFGPPFSPGPDVGR